MLSMYWNVYIFHSLGTSKFVRQNKALDFVCVHVFVCACSL